MKIRPVLILILASMTLSLTALAADWPCYRGSQYDGVSQEAISDDPLPGGEAKVLWRKELGIGFSAFVVANGKAYCAGNNDDKDTIFCFDAVTGKELWKYSYPCKIMAKYYEGGTHGTPTVVGGKLLFLSKQGLLVCVDAARGRLIWKRQLDGPWPIWGFSSSVLVVGKVAYVSVGKYGTAVALATGKVVWGNPSTISNYATPVPYKHGKITRLAIFAQKSICGVDPKTGAVLWEYPWETKYNVNASDPIIVGDKMFISSGYDHGGALIDLKEGGMPEEVYRTRHMRTKMNGAVYYKGFLYGFDKKELKCLDFKTGDVKWSKKGYGAGTVSVAGGKLVILSEAGLLAIAEATDAGFKLIADAPILVNANGKKSRCWTTATYANGKIYARTAKGQAVCVALK